MALTQTQVSELYVAIFGRASEGEGNAFWATKETSEAAATEMFTLSVVRDYFGVTNFTDEANVRTVVEAIYLNSLGKAPADDVAGIQFWVDYVVTDGNSMGAMAAALVVAANDPANVGVAQDTFNNKVAVSNHTADTVEAFTDFAEFQGFISSVDETTASVDAAKVAVDGSVAFSLTTGLAAVDAATDAIAAFLVTADGDDDADTSATESDVDDALNHAGTGAVKAVDDIVAGDYTAASTGVRAALLSDQETANALVLTNANTDVTDANTAVAAVTGLTAAVAAHTAAVAVTTAADAAEAAAIVVEGAEDAAWVFASDADTGIDGSANTAGVLDIDIAGGGTVFADNDNLILTEVSSAGVVTLIDATEAAEAAVSVTTATAEQIAFVEAQQALAADYIAAINANVAAAATAAAAEVAEAAALLVSSNSGALAAAAAAALGADATAYFADPANPTVLEIAALTVARDALVVAIDAVTFDTDEATTEAASAALTTTAVGDGIITVAQKTAIDAAFDGASTIVDGGATLTAAFDAATIVVEAINTAYDGLEATYDAAVLVNTNLRTAVTDAEAAVVAAQLVIDTLADAEADMDAAQVIVDDLAALNVTLTAAETAITGEGFATPVTLAGATAATVADDVFLSATTDSAISSFGVIGSDSLFIGSGYTLNADEVAGDNGDNAVLEVWLTNDSGNTVVTIEDTAFGSEAATPEITTITLTGVAIADVTLVDGLITVA